MAGSKTGIEWTDKVWNPVTGCTKISPGCAHCYAEAMTKRFPKGFPNGFEVTLHPVRLNQPQKWKTPSRIFVNSMSDLFHDDVPLEFIQEVFAVIKKTPWHVFQILTKRDQRLEDLSPQLEWSDNIWVGVSVESQKYTSRIHSLREVPAKVRFLSCEPLLGPLELNLEGIHWVIVGGESGAGHRPIDPDWVKAIQRQCQDANVPFFFKQWGGPTPKSRGNHLDGEIWEQMPINWKEHLRRWQKAPK